jgi:ribosomal protein S27E
MVEAQGRRPVSVRSVNCPNCGAATAVRTFGHAVNVVCQSCRSILDASNPGVTILQRYTEAVREEPLIPLGTRGKLLDIECEVVGFQVREIVVDDVAYQWREYLLFNPYREFRYLTEYAGHWNVVSTLNALPHGGATPDGSAPRSYGQQKYRHFQTAVAKTIFVLGEFSWQIRVGDTTTGSDYVAPPLMLSAEVDADKEVTWSLGRYVSGDEIWKSLSLPGKPPGAVGIFANQPSPSRGAIRAMWRNAALLVAVATLLWLAHLVSARDKQAFAQNFVFDSRTAQEATLVTPIFELDGRPTAVEIETATNLDNQWMFVGYALVNDETGQAFEVARDVSYYHGVEDGESWTEGSPTDTVTLPSVPAGRYFLRIETEGDRTASPLPYRVRVVRDVSTSLWFMVALVLIAVPPILASWRAAKFELRRWQESDHG